MAIRAANAAPAEYGDMLIDVAAGIRPETRPTLAAAGVITTKATLERRLKSMKLMQLNPGIGLRTAALALLCVGLFAILPWRLVAEKPRSVPTPSTAAADRKKSRQAELLRREIELARSQLTETKRQHASGNLSLSEVLRVQKEVSALEHESARLNLDLAEMERTVQDQMQQVRELLDQQKKSISRGS